MTFLSNKRNARSIEEISDELRDTKRALEALRAEVQRNSDKFKRSQRRELKLLQSQDLGALFGELIGGLQESYSLDYVGVVLCDPDHDVRHLLAAGGQPLDSIRQLTLVESLSGLAPQYVALHQPWLGPFARCDHQLLFRGADQLKSVALLPLRHRGHLMGSINFGSTRFDRFTASHATDFFEHLAAIASFCIENAINRARLLRSGFTDALTGWHNRRYLQVRLREELARAKRDQTSLICLMLDIDHFKRVNDTYGHIVGDQVLQELASRVETQVRASDVAARYGGEEFVVLLPDTDLKSGTLLAERIRKAVSGSPVVLGNDETLEVTVSVGIAAAEVHTDNNDLKNTGESLIARADVALYKAKSAGRNRVAVDGD